MSNCLDAERIAEPEEMKPCTRIGAHADVEIELVYPSDLVRCPEVRQVPWSVVFGEVTRVLDKHIPGCRQLSIEQDGGLAGEISLATLSGPIQRQHSGQGPL